MKSFKLANTSDRASILYIKYLIEKQFGNTNQSEIKNNPFENTGGEIEAIGEDFNLHIKAYDWNNEKDGYLKFYHLGDLVAEFRWYKHCLRGLEVRYANCDSDEIIGLIEDCLREDLVSIEEKHITQKTGEDCSDKELDRRK